MFCVIISQHYKIQEKFILYKKIAFPQRNQTSQAVSQEDTCQTEGVAANIVAGKYCKFSVFAVHMLY